MSRIVIKPERDSRGMARMSVAHWCKDSEEGIEWVYGGWIFDDGEQHSIKFCPYCGERLPDIELGFTAYQ